MLEVKPNYLEDHGIILKADHLTFQKEFLAWLADENRKLEGWVIMLE